MIDRPRQGADIDMPVERRGQPCRSFKQGFFVFGLEATERAGALPSVLSGSSKAATCQRTGCVRAPLSMRSSPPNLGPPAPQRREN